MNRIIFINVLVLAAIFAAVLPNSYLLAGDMGWAEERNPGDPLDGFWYMSANGDPGCFDDLVVYEVAGGNFRQVLRGNVLDADIRSIESTELVIEFRTEPGVTSRFYVEDRGQVLWAYRFEEMRNGYLVIEDKNVPLLTTCDKPTTMGVLASLVSKVFNPDQRMNKVTITTLP